MWDLFRPPCEKVEALQMAAKGASVSEPALLGMPEDIDSLIDPEYAEPDPGKQLRDGLLWAATEIVRVIRATEDGAEARFDRASCPPPNAFAISTILAYALAGEDKRRELIGRALGFACKSHDPEPAAPADSEGFLDSLG
jgi:hypothetical protein